MIAAFKGYDYLVAPSGSCGGMIVKHYPELFAEGRSTTLPRRSRGAQPRARVVPHAGNEGDGGRREVPGQGHYHDSCSGLRELGIRNEPRQLLASVEGVTLKEMTDAEVCCGFGGTFCVKYPGISDKMLEKKLKHIAASGGRDTLSRWRPRLSHEHGGQAEARGFAHPRAACGGGSGGRCCTPPIAEANDGCLHRAFRRT